MISAGGTFHSSCFRLASMKMNENTTEFCFCISIWRASFISSYVYAVMSGGPCTISKIVEESIKQIM